MRGSIMPYAERYKEPLLTRIHRHQFKTMVADTLIFRGEGGIEEDIGASQRWHILEEEVGNHKAGATLAVRENNYHIL
jgi:hypothetical protein